MIIWWWLNPPGWVTTIDSIWLYNIVHSVQTEAPTKDRTGKFHRYLNRMLWLCLFGGCYIYLETQDALRKCHPTKVDGFQFFRPKVEICCFRAYPLQIHFGCCAPFFRSCAALLGHYSRCPLILVEAGKLKNYEKNKPKKVPYFFRKRRVYPRSPDALCAANSWLLGCWLMLV